MLRTKWMSRVLFTALLSSGLFAIPANAGNPAAGNQSDITGGNIWNSVSPIFKMNGKLSPEILSTARRLAQELDEVSRRCGNASAPMGPRRFARRPSQVALSPDCQRLDQLVQETRTFLADVKRSQSQQQSATRNRIW
ncbi:hypothetical protein [Allocoleopsis franciscana]|uniref:Conjugal transfer protein n=1 Tax=Allocoleopsis franciscana PCC 7113 TaxID=1173027 RepID=K9WIC1_9CYAN|nr:hypothetical protein [Allocoleopsis franciscana]AFZ20140.1 hypothetical protein Mic7113_4447 [Allocoleopsis franciscana PCC 7113]